MKEKNISDSKKAESEVSAVKESVELSQGEVSEIVTTEKAGKIEVGSSDSKNGRNALQKTKKKKPWTVKRVLGFVAIGVVAVLLVNSIISAIKGPAPILVETGQVQRMDVLQTLNISGVVSTADMKTVFSPVSAPVKAVHIKAGTYVEEGTLMFEYDTTELERSLRMASAALSNANLQAQDAVKASDDSEHNLEVLRIKIENKNIDITNTNNKIAALQAQLNATTDPAEIDSLTQAIEAESANLAIHTSDLARYEAELQGEKQVADKTVMDDNDKKQMNNNKVSPQVAYERAVADLNAGKAGMVAPMSGIVTNLGLVEGASAMQYSAMCVIESIKKVDVLVALSRYDIEKIKIGQKGVVTTAGVEYTATLTHIDAMATISATSTFVYAKVSLDKPDSKLFLGLEGSVKLETGLSKNVIAVPINAVNTDVDGTHCYIIQDGLAVRRSIEIGLSNEEYVEIAAGLQEGEAVILSSQNILDGMAVSDDPAIGKPAATTGGIMIG